MLDTTAQVCEHDDEKKICFSFDVPKNFNIDDYASTFGIKNNPLYAYYHWFMNSKNTLYFGKKQGNMDFDPVNFNIVTANYFHICHTLTKISKYNSRDHGLDKLNEILKTTPEIKINDVVDIFVKTKY